MVATKCHAAVALGKIRAAGLTSEHQSAAASAQAAAMTQKQRKERARIAALARWKKHRKPS